MLVSYRIYIRIWYGEFSLWTDTYFSVQLHTFVGCWPANKYINIFQLSQMKSPLKVLIKVKFTFSGQCTQNHTTRLFTLIRSFVVWTDKTVLACFCCCYYKVFLYPSEISETRECSYQGCGRGHRQECVPKSCRTMQNLKQDEDVRL